MIHERGITADLTPNWDWVTAFLAALEPDGEFTFQALPEARDSSTSPTVLHGALGSVRDRLEALNRHGAGIFVMVNAGDGLVPEGGKSCRTAANVRRVRAVFVDLDGAPVAPILMSALPPDWVVCSSPGRWHAYWRVSDCPLDKFVMTQAALAARFGGDPVVKDLPRVMRVPGFFHQKADPFMSTLYLPTAYQGLQ